MKYRIRIHSENTCQHLLQAKSHDRYWGDMMIDSPSLEMFIQKQRQAQRE